MAAGLFIAYLRDGLAIQKSLSIRRLAAVVRHKQSSLRNLSRNKRSNHTQRQVVPT